MLKNPIKAILRSDSPPGLKVIALSLLLLFVTALPYMAYEMVGPEDGNPQVLGMLFGLGALLAHVGFIVGLLWLMWESYGRGRK
ncbi:hypothetical protein [Marinimicrobium sp. ABcell2]|uniref:hypothetical protein n=1 Tax=Marinimicrobium sp. ABcell2 TaxID=3069751 RepID=UPI0027B69F93|nr:hypothetical protein [Marinimicrobium sp. ABcell2]MDQ2078358.1 hypothetical protein [Marinimicrobium sp. ABcell2]